MKIYYKATKPDGFDFYTGTVDYAGALAAGRPVARKTAAGDGYACCTDTVYHASDAAAETLVGSSWPCRLFEVTGRPVAQQGHKFGFRSLRVLREIPAHLALGPNGEATVALIDRASRLTFQEASRLAAAWNAAWNGAWTAALDAAWDASRTAALDAARDAAWGAAWGATRTAALDAARAAIALVLRDLISAEHFQALHGPWSSVISATAEDS